MRRTNSVADGSFDIGVCRRWSIVTLSLYVQHEWAAHSRVLTMTHRIITLLEACNRQVTTVLKCCISNRPPAPIARPPDEFPPFLAPSSSSFCCGLGGAAALWPSGWRLSFHISITSVAFCIWTRVWFLPLLQLTPSLHPSIAADRFLKRSGRRWAAEEGGGGGRRSGDLLPTWPRPVGRPALRSNLGGLKPAMFRFLSVWKLTERH